MQGGRKPDADHPIHIEPAPERVVVRMGGRILADSRHALMLREASYPPVFYIPRAEVAMDALVATQTRSHCPYKGDARYWAAGGGGRDIAWSYEDPFEPMAAIAGHVAFYRDRVDAIEMLPTD